MMRCDVIWCDVMLLNVTIRQRERERQMNGVAWSWGTIFSLLSFLVSAVSVRIKLNWEDQEPELQVQQTQSS